jgi:hypothetical protein
MIHISGAARRSFDFAAELPTAFAYYSDVGRLLHYLPHISLVRDYGRDRFRMLYNTTELGTYKISIFADVQTTLESSGNVIRVSPLDAIKPVRPQAGLHTSTAQGCFASQSVFRRIGGQTRIEYDLQLRCELPTPLGLRLMPAAVVNRVARRITQWRMREIAEGFIARSVAAFPHWLDELEHPVGMPM